MNDDTNENVSPAPDAAKKKMSAREMMALRKAAEEGDADAIAQLDALKTAPTAAPPPLAIAGTEAGATGAVAPAPVEGEPKKKMSAREMMALRKAAEEGDADAIAQLDALKTAPATALPAATAGTEAGATVGVASVPEPAVAPAPRPAPAAKPAALPPPVMTDAQESELARFKTRFGSAILDSGLSVDTLRLTVGAESIVEAAKFCQEIGYNYPDTITAVDFMEEAKFRVVYILANIPVITRTVMLHVEIPRGGQPSLPTISHIYPGADWDEREIYDLFGIVFEGHPDLRRIMTPDDWEGHPLRKDYTFID